MTEKNFEEGARMLILERCTLKQTTRTLKNLNRSLIIDFDFEEDDYNDIEINF